MKTLLLFLLLTAFTCSGQRTYVVTQGELAFIHPKEGIILFKDNNYFKIEIKADVDKVISYEVIATPISDEQITKLKANERTIQSHDLLSVDTSKLKKLQFIGDFRNDINSINYLNKEFFVVKDYPSEKVDPQIEQIKYFYIKLGNKVIIKLFGSRDGFILNNKDKIVLYPLGWGPEKYKTVKRKAKLGIQDIEQLKFGHYYRIDTLAGKVGLLNYFNEWTLPAKYDSIVITSNFLATFFDKKLELYNAALTNLKIEGLRAVEQEKYLPYAYILQNNKKEMINVNGGNKIEIQGRTGYDSSEQSYPVEISKQEGIFYVESPEAGVVLSGEEWDGQKKQLYNTENIDSIYVWKDRTGVNSMSHISGIVICKMKSGKFKLEYLINLLLKYSEKSDGSFGGDKIAGVFDEVEDKNNYLKVRKDGLTGYYPFNKEARYKEIDEYRGFGFIRFTLLDCRKGWLSTNGKEYLDE